MTPTAVATGYEHMFREAVREGVSLIVGFAGASGSGKTMSAMRLAQGIVGRDTSFAVIDTEARRALHYAPRRGEAPDFIKTFRFAHAELRPPFRPAAYQNAITAAARAGYGAIVVDSFSHEHEGEGGHLDWAEEILEASVKRALERGDKRGEWALREAFKRSAWIEPKRERKRMVQALLQLRANIILCLRAEDKIDFVKDADGKTRVVPMETLAGFKGWIPICDKRLPFELTASFVLTPDQPGIPKPIKLQEQHKDMFPAGKPVDEESGRKLAEWARGGSVGAERQTRGQTAGDVRQTPLPPERPVKSPAADSTDDPRERAALIADARRLGGVLKMSEADRRATAALHVGPDIHAGTLAQLTALVNALREAASETPWRYEAKGAA